MKNTREVRVIGFVTNKVRNAVNPIPDDYLSGEVNIPPSLIDEVKANGWQDEKGVLWWSEDFQPAPVKDSDGNVYLLISNSDAQLTSRLAERLDDARRLLLS